MGPGRCTRPGVTTPDKLRPGTTFREQAGVAAACCPEKMCGEAAMAAAPQSIADSFIIETRHLTKECSGFVAVELSYGRKRALEIATTLAMDPELMLLDEPTQGMGHEDVDRVTTLIKQASAKRTILMVEHNMQVVAKIADTITVLQRGQIIDSGTYAEVSRNPLVIEAYMGSTDAELRMPH